VREAEEARRLVRPQRERALELPIAASVRLADDSALASMECGWRNRPERGRALWESIASA
jgi:hypothetical protein